MRCLTLSVVMWLVVCLGVWGVVPAAEPTLSPVLKKDVVGLVHWSGGEAWEAYQKTASYRAFYESGLMPTLTQHIQRMPWQSLVSQVQGGIGIPIQPADIEALAKTVWHRGVTVAMGLQERETPAPYMVFIVRGCSDQFPRLQQFAKLHAAEAAQQIEVSGRTLLRFTDEQWEVDCWSEGPDLVLFYTFGEPSRRAVVDTLFTAVPEDLLVEQPQWVESWSGEPVPTDSFRAWFNFTHLAKCLPRIPEVQAVRGELAAYEKVIGWLGVDRWQTWAYRSGCHGDHVVNQWSLQAEVTPLQWAGWGEQTVTLADLPPLPVDVTSFSLQAIDSAKVYTSLREVGQELQRHPEQVIQFLSELGLPGATVNTQSMEQNEELQRRIQLGLEALGPAVCIYQDRQQQVLPWGVPTIALAVKDREALITQLDTLPLFGWKRDDRWGCPTYYRTTAYSPAPAAGDAAQQSLSINASFGSMTIAVCDQWLVCGMQPQMVKTFVLRSQGKLPKWSLDQMPAVTREKLPVAFSRLTYSVPRAAVAMIGSLAPWMSDGLRTLESTLNVAAQQLPLLQQAASAEETGIGFTPQVIPAIARGPAPSPLDIPPVEVMNSHLFPNVSVTVITGTTIRQRSYGSTFMDRPLFWGVGGYILLTIGVNAFGG